MADLGIRMAALRAPPQGIARTIVFILIGWVEEKLRAVWCAAGISTLFLAVLEAVAAFVG